MTKQALNDGRISPFSYITHAAMESLHRYFEMAEGAKLSTGLALYMGIAYLTSIEKRRRTGIEKTREQIGAAGGVSATNVTRYADHLIEAEVLELEQQVAGGANLYIWTLVEPPSHAPLHGGEAVGVPLHHGETPAQGGEAPHQGGEAYIEEENNKKTDKKTTPCSPPEGDTSDDDPVTEIFELWKRLTSRNGSTKFSPKRRKAIVRSLREGFTVAELERAIRGNLASDYHQKRGKHFDREGPVYDELHRILADAERIEMFTKLAPLQGTTADLPELAGFEHIEEAKADWETVKAGMRAGQVAESTFRLWIEPFECVGVLPGTRTIVLCDTESLGLKSQHLQWASRRYKGLFLSALSTVPRDYDGVELVDETQLELAAR